VPSITVEENFEFFFVKFGVNSHHVRSSAFVVAVPFLFNSIHQPVRWECQ